ncbi:MAG: DivIVA domain-containing protein [Actinobacteria bacterium]|nr:DivIVA domain-containing protein [Actinomycetota bacterium]MBV8958498.1 DivIVA domain-containing protein [Actinomycetota bacterium]MBV9255736.1 DivIVA domain-containing protein [Actinomycetota bacterium]
MEVDVSAEPDAASPEATPIPEQAEDKGPAREHIASDAAIEAAVQEGLVGMDVSAQTLRDVKFREKFRGYHPDDVDEFLEQVAEGITYLQGRLREAQQGAGFDPDDPDKPIENNEALRRTLVLAQRTADLALQEARHEAERIQSQAKQHAETIVSRAEEAARRTVEETNARLREEVGKLEAARVRLRSDVDELEHYLEQQRQQLHASLSAALSKVEDVLPAPSETAPEQDDAEVPAVPWPEPVERSALWALSDDDEPSLAIDEEPAPEAATPLTVVEDAPDGVEEDADGARAAAPRTASIWAAAATGDDEPWDAGGSALDDDDDDPFIAELRRAITDTSPLGPRDDLPLGPPERLEQPQEQEVPGRRRFRRKGR